MDTTWTTKKVVKAKEIMNTAIEIVGVV